MFRMFWRKKVLIIFLAAIVLLFPAASVKPAQMLSKTLFLSVGIDKVAGEYEISGIVSVNKFSTTGEKTSKPISERGPSVNAALKKIAANQGRKVSLAHCNLIVVGSGLADENLAAALHHFLRQYEMSNNALIIYTDSDVKALLEASAANKTGATGGMLETIAASDKTATLDGFYKNYLRPGHANILNLVSLEGDSINNSKSGAVFKNGKKVLTLTADQMTAIKFVNSKPINEPIILNLNDNPDDPAGGTQAVLDIKSKSSQIKTGFKNGFPFAKITINTTADVQELINPQYPEEFLNFEKSLPTAPIQSALTEKLYNDLHDSLRLVKTHETDFLQLYDYFHRYNTADFAKYIKTHSIEEFLSEIIFQVIVKVRCE